MSVPNFFTEFRILNSGTEIPEAYTMWCAISTISAALGRRVYIDMGPFQIYPNHYIILVAGSGKLRKSTALGVARNLLLQLATPPNLISKKMTSEALVSELQTGGDSNGIIVSDSSKGQGFLIADELTNFLNQRSNDNGLGDLLLELYDCSDFSASTKSRGKEIIKNPQLGILAGTTPLALRKAIPPEAIGSGLASRLLFVYEEKPMKPIAYPIYSPRQLEAKEFCVRALSRIQSLQGRIVISPEVRKWGEDCYAKRCFDSPMYRDPYLSGYASRRFIHLHKLAIAFCVGIRESIDLDVRSFEQAETVLETNELNLRRIIRLVTMNDKGEQIDYVYSLIKAAGHIDREDLLAEISHRMESRDLTEVCETLNKSGKIKIEHNGSSLYYSVKGG